MSSTLNHPSTAVVVAIVIVIVIVRVIVIVIVVDIVIVTVIVTVTVIVIVIVIVIVTKSSLNPKPSDPAERAVAKVIASLVSKNGHVPYRPVQDALSCVGSIGVRDFRV